MVEEFKTVPSKYYKFSFRLNNRNVCRFLHFRAYEDSFFENSVETLNSKNFIPTESSHQLTLWWNKSSW